MDSEQTALSRRLVACDQWRWVPGILAVTGADPDRQWWRVLDVSRNGNEVVAVDDMRITCRWRRCDDGWRVTRFWPLPDDVVCEQRHAAITLWPGPNHWRPDMSDWATRLLVRDYGLEIEDG